MNATEFTYEKAKTVLIEALTNDASLHEVGSFDELGSNFDEIDAGLPRDGGANFANLFFALEFWAGWLDSSNHGWLFYEPIQVKDWPIYARTVVADLEADRDTTEPALLKHFSPRPPRPSFVSRILSRISGAKKSGC